MMSIGYLAMLPDGIQTSNVAYSVFRIVHECICYCSLSWTSSWCMTTAVSFSADIIPSYIVIRAGRRVCSDTNDTCRFEKFKKLIGGEVNEVERECICDNGNCKRQ